MHGPVRVCLHVHMVCACVYVHAFCGMRCVGAQAVYMHLYARVCMCVLESPAETVTEEGDGGGSLLFPSSPLKLAGEAVRGAKGLGRLLFPKVPPPAGKEGREEAAPYLNANH